jgi:hypothetical protein
MRKVLHAVLIALLAITGLSLLGISAAQADGPGNASVQPVKVGTPYLATDPMWADPDPNQFPANGQPGPGCNPLDETACAYSSPDHFALACDFPSLSKRARVDFREFDVYQGRTKVDTSGILYRSLTTSNGSSTWHPERVEIQLYNRGHITGPNTAGAWEGWTSKGGGSGDGVLVGGRVEYNDWDPATKFELAATFTGIRMVVWTTAGTSCTSPAVAIS